MATPAAAPHVLPEELSAVEGVLGAQAGEIAELKEQVRGLQAEMRKRGIRL